MKKLLRKRLLLEMEVQKRIIAFYKARIDCKASKGGALSSPQLLSLSYRQDKHLIQIMKLKTQYQQIMKESLNIVNGKFNCNDII